MKRRNLVLTFILALTLIGLVPSNSAQAASADCLTINFNWPMGGPFAPTFGAGFGIKNLAAGDKLTGTATSPNGGVTINIILQGTTVATGVNSVSYTLPAAFSGNVNFTYTTPPPDPRMMALTAKCGDGSAAGGGSAVKFFDPGDDRQNREPGQPAAVYCRNKGDVHIYAVNVDDSKGKLALLVTKAEIDAVINANPSANTLIKQSSDGKFKLFYLPATKELSFITTENSTGKQYSHVWKGLCR